MELYLNTIAFLLIPSFVISLALLLYGLKLRRESELVPYFIVFEVFSLLWIIGYGIELSSVDIDTVIQSKLIKYLGIIFITPTWLALALMYTRKYSVWSNIYTCYLYMLPFVLSYLLLLTNDFHHLFYTSVWMHDTVKGIFFWVFSGIAYIYYILSFVLYGKFIFTPRGAVYRSQSVFMVAASVIPLVANTTRQVNLIGDIDFTSILFSITGMMFFLVIFKHKLFSVVPIANHEVLNNMRDGVLVLSKDLKIVNINSSITRMFEVQFKDILEAGLRGFFSIIGFSDPEQIKEIESGMNLKKAMELDLDLPSLTVNFMAHPIYSETSRSIGYIIIFHDITLRKNLETQILRAKDEAELYLDLMSHDINNQNCKASLYLELLSLKKGDIEGHLEHIKTSKDAVLESSRIIKNVRKLREITYGNQKSYPVDLNLVLGEMVVEHSKTTSKEVIINYEPFDAMVHANDLIRDVFSNLLGNAVKYSGDSVTIDVSVDELDLEGEYYVKVSIEDNGNGIPDEMKGQIFARLKRGKESIQGSGLGLYIVKGQLENYGGEIWVEDRVDGDPSKGARFVVLVPKYGNGLKEETKMIDRLLGAVPLDAV